MKILFVYPNINTRNGLHYPHGIGALAAVSQENRHDPKVWIIDRAVDSTKIKTRLARENPDFVALGFSSHQFHYAREIAGIAKSEGFVTLAIPAISRA